jgi:hypothetical protein
MDPQGNHVGYIAEEDSGFGQLMVRQWAKTHRAFTTHVFDKHGVEVLKVCLLLFVHETISNVCKVP